MQAYSDSESTSAEDEYQKLVSDAESYASKSASDISLDQAFTAVDAATYAKAYVQVWRSSALTTCMPRCLHLGGSHSVS